jgi:hypothetical protein
MKQEVIVIFSPGFSLCKFDQAMAGLEFAALGNS